jgi:uncharacterized protein YkwD
MNGSRQARIRATLIVSAGIAASPALGSATDALSAVQVLREGGCGGVVPATRPLRHEFALDGVAQQWAAGLPLWAAAERSGYPALTASGLFLSASAGPELEQLRRFSCLIVTSLDLRAVGVYRRGPDSWIVMLGDSHATAVPAAVNRIAPPLTNTRPFDSSPPLASSPAPVHSTPAVLAAQALQLVNEVRARGVRCGGRQFAPAPPLTLSGTLAGVALGHAADMAEHDYFEHRDLSGQSPADRVRAVGYREKLVGENIAYGPKTLEEVVQGWLDSPGHCENIMDPRFAEMGLAYAAGQSGRHGLYWVQLFAEPQT